MESSLSEFARALGYETCARIIADFDRPLPSAAPQDNALAQPSATDAPSALAQLVRRGFDPSLVAVLRSVLGALPLDRGLFAWDVLNGALLPRDSTLDSLRVDARRKCVSRSPRRRVRYGKRRPR